MMRSVKRKIETCQFGIVSIIVQVVRNKTQREVQTVRGVGRGIWNWAVEWKTEFFTYISKTKYFLMTSALYM